MAKVDPFYAIAEWPGKRGAWNRDEFYEVGRSDWADCESHWRQYVPDLAGTCVEVGCGAGRMTKALANTFSHVIGLDVSEDMLVLARNACPANVELRLIDGFRIPLKDASVDAVFTCYMLEHLERAAHVREYLAEMRRVLRRGGSAMIQVGLRQDRPFEDARQAARRAKMLVMRRVLSSGKQVIAFTGADYTREQVRSWLVDVGFADAELREFITRSNGLPAPFWLVRAPPH